jgi:hypothetical protein
MVHRAKPQPPDALVTTENPNEPLKNVKLSMAFFSCHLSDGMERMPRPF